MRAFERKYAVSEHVNRGLKLKTFLFDSFILKAGSEVTQSETKKIEQVNI